MEYFTVLIDMAVMDGTVVPLHIPNAPLISHLIYADDPLVFVEGSGRSLMDWSRYFTDWH